MLLARCWHAAALPLAGWLAQQAGWLAGWLAGWPDVPTDQLCLLAPLALCCCGAPSLQSVLGCGCCPPTKA